MTADVTYVDRARAAILIVSTHFFLGENLACLPPLMFSPLTQKKLCSCHLMSCTEKDCNS